MEALQPLRFPPWPYPGPVRFTETNPETLRSQNLLFDQWCVIDPMRLAPLEFHPEVFKLLRRTIARQPGRFDLIG
jgi:hypothetical protein